MSIRVVIGLIVVAVLLLGMGYAIARSGAASVQTRTASYLQDDATSAAVSIVEAIRAGGTPSATSFSYTDPRLGAVAMSVTTSATTVSVTATSNGLSATEQLAI